jgi:hypothetical protein
MICIVAKVIYDGTKQGLFEVLDVVLAAMFAITAMRWFFNPLMIAQSAHKPEPALDQMIDFVAFMPRAGTHAKICPCNASCTQSKARAEALADRRSHP